MTGRAARVVLVGAGEASDPTPSAMDRATRGAAEAATVDVREARSPSPTDDEALALEKTLPPTAVVELRWTDAAHRKALLRVHLSLESRWVERTVAFKPSDAIAERGRTLGFAVAAMMPEGRTSAMGAGAGTATGAATGTAPGTATATAPATATPTAPPPAPPTAPAAATATPPPTSTS